MPDETDRSSAAIELADLLRLADLADDAETELFRRHPNGSGRYEGRLLGRVLCQGGALRYVSQRNGVKDFDVWSFYAQCGDWPFPPRWRGTRDFGPSKFGRWPGDPARFADAVSTSWDAHCPSRQAAIQPMPSAATSVPVGRGRRENLRPKRSS